ncbi:MAG TPA: dual specificity protein phosphatase [Gammaproteobacteria bacterium]|nr:dual specificity protein phosphatase [Gammaproteobacteria bacterium]
MLDFVHPRLAIGDAGAAATNPGRFAAGLCVAEEIALPGGFRAAHKVPIVDMQPIPERQLQEAVEWLRAWIGEGPLLVFCNAGVGRSSSVVVGYFCTVLGYRFGDAVEHVARRHPNMSLLPFLLPTIEAVRERLGTGPGPR